MLGTIDKELTIYDFRIINCKTKERPFIIYNSSKKTIIYYEEQIKFDIIEIKCYNIIFGILQLYKYNLQINWIINLISTTWHHKNKFISIKRDLTIGNVYKERDTNKSIQIIRILNSTDIFFFIETVFEEYQKFILEEYRQYRTLFCEIKDLRLLKYKL